MVLLSFEYHKYTLKNSFFKVGYYILYAVSIFIEAGPPMQPRLSLSGHLPGPSDPCSFALSNPILRQPFIWIIFAVSGLIICYQQFIDRFSFRGDRADRTKNTQAPNPVLSIQIVEKGVLRIFLPGIGVGEHSLNTPRIQFFAESRQPDLLRIIEVLRHIGGTGVGFIDRLIRRIEIKERPFRCELLRLHVIAVENFDIFQQLAVRSDQFRIQQIGSFVITESKGQFPLFVHGVDGIVTRPHKKHE